MTTFSPQIVAFCCNWCSYAGADLAGVSRFQYPPTARIIRIMCSGRLEPQFILRAFEIGADGVLVAGCHLGECHYISGNERAKVKVAQTQELLDMLGVDRRRAAPGMDLRLGRHQVRQDHGRVHQASDRNGPQPLKGEA